MVISEKIDELLKKDLTGIGSTKRNPEKVQMLKEQHQKMQEYFEGKSVKVKLLLNTGFNTAGDIILEGDNIIIDDKDILNIFLDGTAYINFYVEDNKLRVQLAHADLITEEKKFERQSSTEIMSKEELADAIRQWSGESKKVLEFGDDYAIYDEECTIRHNSLFWYIISEVAEIRITKLNNQRIRVEFSVGNQ